MPAQSYARANAKAIRLGIDKSITTSATLVGALPYMAPEFIKDPKTADRPADVWSLGAILYELMSGDKPFGTGHVAIANIIKAKLPPKPTIAQGNLQFETFFDALWVIVKACLHKDASDRPTADDLVGMCGDLCYSVHKRHTGMIKRYGADKGAFGFISRALGADVFFHKDSYYGAIPKVGQLVAFSCFASADAERAHPVVPLRPGSNL